MIDLEGGLARQQPLPPAEFGPHIDFRESSFLHNPALSAQVNGSRLTVRLCAAGGARAAGCADGSAAAKVQANVVKVKAGLDSEKWAKALSGLEGHKILWFEAMDGAFGGFKDNGAQHKFDRRMAMYASLWCCGHSSPGHVWCVAFGLCCLRLLWRVCLSSAVDVLVPLCSNMPRNMCQRQCRALQSASHSSSIQLPAARPSYIFTNNH